jgi:adenosylhomocysteine nucleosidase
MPEPTRAAAYGFVCAMPMELVPLAEKLSLVEEQVGDATVHTGKLGDHDVVAIVTGMGTAYARQGTERLLDAFAVAHVVSVGITGGVENETPIGTVVLPELVLHRGTGTEHRPAPLGGGTHSGTMATGDDLLSDVVAVDMLRAAGVVALEMETGAIAQVCEARGVRWSVFRAISDQPRDNITQEVFTLSNLDGTPNHDAIAKFFEEHPEKLEEMAKLAENSTLAAERAAQAAIDACLHGQAVP